MLSYLSISSAQKKETAERTMSQLNNALGGLSTVHTTDRKDSEFEEVD